MPEVSVVLDRIFSTTFSTNREPLGGRPRCASNNDTAGPGFGAVRGIRVSIRSLRRSGTLPSSPRIVATDS
ncbi:MAG: hypothetical protein ACKOET_21035, partial [Verrucomicrobiota bacterium]